MINKSALSDIVVRALSPDIDVITLRGTDAYSREGGDIDIVVPAGLAGQAALRIARAAVEAGWAFVGWRDLGYVFQLCLIFPNPEHPKDYAIKIDVSNGLSWRGIGEDRFGDIVFGEQRAGSSVEQLGMIATFLQKILYPGYLRDRDIQRIRMALDSGTLQRFCNDNGLPIDPLEIVRGRAGPIAKWRMRAASSGVIGGTWIPWLVNVAWQALRARAAVGTGAGQLVGFAGMDGSGKSTLANRFSDAVSRSEFAVPIEVHLLPAFIPMPHRLIRRSQTTDNYLKPYSEPPVTSVVSSGLRLGYYILAFLAARLWCYYRVSRGDIIIMDRSVIDFISDLNRARIPHIGLPKFILRSLLPSGRFYYVNASPEVAIRRKNELTIDRARFLSQSYAHAVSCAGATVLNADAGPGEVYIDFLSVLSNKNVANLRQFIGRKS